MFLLKIGMAERHTNERVQGVADLPVDHRNPELGNLAKFSITLDLGEPGSQPSGKVVRKQRPGEINWIGAD